MGNRYYQLDMTGALTAYLFLGNLDTASVADDTLVAYALVLAAGALIVLGRTEDALAEESVTLWLIGTIVNRLWFGNLAKRIFQDFFGRSQSDGNLRKIILYFCIFLKSHCLEIIKGSRLIKFDTQTKTTEFVEKYVE